MKTRHIYNQIKVFAGLCRCASSLKSLALRFDGIELIEAQSIMSDEWDKLDILFAAQFLHNKQYITICHYASGTYLKPYK